MFVNYNVTYISYLYIYCNFSLYTCNSVCETMTANCCVIKVIKRNFVQVFIDCIAKIA